MKKQIILINSSLSGGGSERAMTNLANYLNQHDYKVMMVLVRKKEKDYDLDPEVELVQLENNYTKVRLFFKRLYDLRRIFKEKTDFCIISFMTDINFFSIVSSLGIRNKTLIVSERNDPSSLKGTTKIMFKIVEQFFYKYADKIVFQTETVKRMYSKKLQDKSSVIPNMVEVDSKLRNINKINNEIIAVGRLTYQKNFQLLLNSFAEVQKKYPNLKLSIYGNGPLREDLISQADSLGISKSVQFYKFEKDILSKVAKAKLFVSTSNYEGISNAMLEALAIGVPSICTDCPVGGASLAIQSGINGFLFPVGNHEELVDKIERVLDNPILYNEISINAANSMKKFSSSVIGKRWEDIIS